jgi:ubiquinone/menaquinone biosynthesis C-methylase UbiE
MTAPSASVVADNAGVDSDPADESVGAVRDFFDALGAAEWDRLVESPSARVALELHRRFLRRFVQPGWRVLEVGAGPGRFTVELARASTSVVVSDISGVQLELNRARVAEAGCEHAVHDRRVLDIRDLSAFADGAFDCVLAYGGPISYAFEDAGKAFAECVRVTRPGGVVLASVMSSIGNLRYYLPGVAEEIKVFGAEAMDAVVHTGDLRPTQAGRHICRIFRWREIAEMISAQPCRLLAASASNAISLGDPSALERLAADPQLWPRLLDWEEELAQEPGMLDGGTHILFAVEKVRHPSPPTAESHLSHGK